MDGGVSEAGEVLGSHRMRKGCRCVVFAMSSVIDGAVATGLRDPAQPGGHEREIRSPGTIPGLTPMFLASGI